MALQSMWASTIGLIFLLVGVVGLFPGTYAISTTLDWVHIVAGIVLLAAVLKRSPRQTNFVFGIAFGIAGILGFMGFFESLSAGPLLNTFYLVLVGIPSLIISQISFDDESATSL